MNATRICFKEVKDIALAQISIDKPEKGGILVQNLYTMISPGTELAIYNGIYAKNIKQKTAWSTFPMYPGYSAVGCVVEVSDDVDEFTVGDIVFYPAKHGNYDWYDVSSNLAVKINDFQKKEHGLFLRFIQIASTAMRVSDFQSGECVLVFGLGMIGNLASQIFKMSGGQVIGADPVSVRREMAKKCGIMALDPNDGDFDEDLLRLTYGNGPKVVVDATGVPAVINTALRVAAECGQVILLGSPRGKIEVDFYANVHVKGVSITGAHERMQRMLTKNRGGAWDRTANTIFAAEALREGRIKVEHLITDYFTPERAVEAYEKLCDNKKESLGVVIDWRKFKNNTIEV